MKFMSHPKGYTKEMIKEILGSSWPQMPEDHETGNQLRRRKGREMREGKRPYPTYPAKKVGPNFDGVVKYRESSGSLSQYNDCYSSCCCRDCTLLHIHV